MTNLPRVSIVTPSYNQAAFLDDTLRSVLTQDYPHIEYIVMDGGSTDGSVELIRKYENQIAYWTSERDNGQADAINKGWSRATGEIVAYLNSDDTYEPGAVRTAVEHLTRHPETDMVYGHCYQVNEHGERVGMLNAIPVNIRTLLLHNAIMQPTTFFRRRVLDKVGLLDIELGHAMDYDLWLRIALHHRIDALNVALANFRAHDESKSFAKPFIFIQDIRRILTRFFANPNLDESLRPLETQALVNWHMTTLLSCFAMEQREAGLQVWNEMVDTCPTYWTQSDELVELTANTAVHNVETAWGKAQAQDGALWVHDFLQALPASAATLRAMESRIVARICTIHAFQAYAQRDFERARAEISRAWRQDPRLLRNRGLASVWAKSLFGATPTIPAPPVQ